MKSFTPPLRGRGIQAMTELLALATILFTVLIGAVSPGPSFILVVRTSVARSRRHGLAAAAGFLAVFFSGLWIWRRWHAPAFP